jgi:hypothetical protein
VTLLVGLSSTKDYQDARVFGHIAQIDMTGKIKGRTSMMLRFDRLVMPDGRRAQIHAEIVGLYHAPSGEKVGCPYGWRPQLQQKRCKSSPVKHMIARTNLILVAFS